MKLRKTFLAALPLLLLLPAATSDAGDRFDHRQRVRAQHDRQVIRRTHRAHRSHFDHVQRVRTRHLSCRCRTVWKPGFYKVVDRRVWTPGYYERVWVPARFGTEFCFGRRISIQIGGGYYERVYRPGCYKTIRDKIWVPGRYVTTTRCGRH